jgi:hypothetical protein
VERLSYQVPLSTQAVPIGVSPSTGYQGSMIYLNAVIAYFSFGAALGKAPTSSYSQFSAVAKRTALSLSQTVLTAAKSQSPEQMMVADQMAQLALVEMYANLAQASMSRRASSTAANEEYLEQINRTKLGHLFVADDAIVETVHVTSSYIKSGDAVATVRRVFSSQVWIDETEGEIRQLGLVPAGRLTAHLRCPGVFPIAAKARAQWFSHANRTAITEKLKVRYKACLYKKSFAASVLRVGRGEIASGSIRRVLLRARPIRV